MSTETKFDPFGDEEIKLPQKVFYGEIVILDGYKGIKVQGERGFPPYDPESKSHQEAIANGKKVYIVYKVQHFPLGVSYETYPMDLPIWSDGWKMFEQGFGKVLGLNPEDKKERSELYGVHFRNMMNGGTFCEYETPLLRTYDKGDGTVGKIFGINVLKIFESEEDCEQAFNESEDGKIEEFNKQPKQQNVVTLDWESSKGFIQNLAGQVKSTEKEPWDTLQELIDGFPMLKGISVKDKKVQELVVDSNQETFGIPF